MSPYEYQDYKHWSDVPEDVWRWPHFTAQEIACQHCGAVRLVPDALDKLEAARLLYGRPIGLISAYRCESHPITLEKIEDKRRRGWPLVWGSHQSGTGFDVKPTGEGANLAEMEDAFHKTGVMGRGKGIREGAWDRTLCIHFDWDNKLGKRSWGY